MVDLSSMQIVEAGQQGGGGGVRRYVPEPVPVAGCKEHQDAIEYAPDGAEDLHRYNMSLSGI